MDTCNVGAEAVITRAPFRADQVGSLLRPHAVKAARAEFASGELTAGELEEVEDVCINEVIARQQSVGLKAATDGEFRRAWWHFDFLAGLGGVELVRGDESIQFHGVQTKAENLLVSGKVAFNGHPMLDHFRFLKNAAQVTAKFTIPSPTVLHFRVGRNAISRDVYPDLAEFFHDTALAYRDAVAACVTETS